MDELSSLNNKIREIDETILLMHDQKNKLKAERDNMLRQQQAYYYRNMYKRKTMQYPLGEPVCGRGLYSAPELAEKYKITTEFDNWVGIHVVPSAYIIDFDELDAPEHEKMRRYDLRC